MLHYVRQLAANCVCLQLGALQIVYTLLQIPNIRDVRSFRLTLLLGLARHIQVDGGQAQLAGLLSGQVSGWLVRLLHGVADTETAPHGGNLPIKLLPCDLVVKAQPAELDLHPEGTVEREREKVTR